MNALVLAAAFSLAATLPIGALGWGVGRLADRLGWSPRLRAGVWSGAILSSLASAALVPLWRPHPLPQARVHTTIVLGTTPAPVHAAAAASAPPAWMALIAPITEALVAVLALGGLVALGLLAARLVRARRMARQATPTTDERLLGFVLGRAGQMGLIAPGVRVSDKAPTAMLIGMRRPTILLPRALTHTLSAEELRWICAHELAHLARGDNHRILTDRVIAAMFWFNPFITDALERRAAVREELCDAIALAGAAPYERRRYAATLVQALRLSGAGQAHLAFIRRQGTGHAMRLKAILQPTAKPSRIATVGATVLLAATALTGVAVSAAVAQQLGKTTAAAADAAKARQPDGKPSGDKDKPESKTEESGLLCYNDVSRGSGGHARICLTRSKWEPGHPRPTGDSRDGNASTYVVRSDGVAKKGVQIFTVVDGKTKDGKAQTFTIDGDDTVDALTLTLADGLKQKLGHMLVIDDKDASGPGGGEGKAHFFVKSFSSEDSGGGHSSSHSVAILSDRSTSTKNGDVMVFEGHPSIHMVGAGNPNAKVLIDGKATPDGTDLNTLKLDHIERIETHSETGPDGKRSSTVNIITKPTP